MAEGIKGRAHAKISAFRACVLAGDGARLQLVKLTESILTSNVTYLSALVRQPALNPNT